MVAYAPILQACASSLLSRRVDVLSAVWHCRCCRRCRFVASQQLFFIYIYIFVGFVQRDGLRKKTRQVFFNAAYTLLLLLLVTAAVDIYEYRSGTTAHHGPSILFCLPVFFFLALCLCVWLIFRQIYTHSAMFLGG